MATERPHWTQNDTADHRRWEWRDPATGVFHRVGIGNASHSESQAQKTDFDRVRQRVRRCEAGGCACSMRQQPAQLAQPVQQAPQTPLTPGAKVLYGGQEWYITEMEGGLAALVNMQGQEELVPVAELQRAANTGQRPVQPPLVDEDAPLALELFYWLRGRQGEADPNSWVQAEPVHTPDPLPGAYAKTAMAYPGPLYHVAPAQHRDAIHAEGLRGHEPDFPRFNPTGYGRGIPGNYAFDTPGDAEYYAHMMARRGQPMDIWQINHAGSLPVEQDPESYLYGGGDEIDPRDAPHPYEFEPEWDGLDGVPGDMQWHRRQPHDWDEEYDGDWHEDERSFETVPGRQLAWRIPAHVPAHQLEHLKRIHPDEGKWTEEWYGDQLEGDQRILTPEPIHRVRYESPEAYQKAVRDYLQYHKSGAGDGDGYVMCDQGHEHWGTNGAAGLLASHQYSDGRTRYFLTLRSQDVQHGGTWSTPGGAMDSHEDPQTAALRETGEEIGHEPPVTVRGVDTDDHGGWAYHTVRAEAHEPFTHTSDSWETEDSGWFTPEEIDRLPLHPGFASYWRANRNNL